MQVEPLLSADSPVELFESSESRPHRAGFFFVLSLNYETIVVNREI